MKKQILTITTILALCVSTQAANIAFNTGGSRGHAFVLSTSTSQAGNIGTPTLTDRVALGQVVQAGWMEAGVFQLFASSAIANPLTTATIGGFLNTATGQNAAASGGFSVIAGKQVALLVQGQNGDRGLFTSTSWMVPPTLGTAVDQSYTVILANASGAPPVVTALPIEGYTTGSVTVGTIGFTSGNTPAYSERLDGNIMKLGAPIPEPSVVALLGLLGLVGLRRRR